MGCGVWGVGCGVWGVGCGAWGVGCVVQGVGADPRAERCKDKVVDVVSPRGTRENLPRGGCTCQGLQMLCR